MSDPQRSLVPASLEEAAQILARSAAEGDTVRIAGAGTKRHWRFLGRAAPASRTLSTAGLTRLVDHVPADLTVTVQAGMPLSTLQEVLSGEGQWLPIDPPLASQATVGGTLATGAVGLRRLRYGAPRDRVLQMRVAYPSGEVARTGAPVVKNVAGFDVHRLHAGAFGTLGLIGEVTFKVAPRPPARAAILLEAQDLQATAILARCLAGGPLCPAVLVLASHVSALGGGAGLVTVFEDLPANVERCLAEVLTMAGSPPGAVVQRGEVGLLPDHELLEAPLQAPLALRLWTRPSALGSLANALARTDLRWCIDALTGAAYAGRHTHAGDRELDADPILEILARWIESATVVVAPDGATIPPRAMPDAGALNLMRSVRRALDPRWTLNPGLGPPA